MCRSGRPVRGKMIRSRGLLKRMMGKTKEPIEKRNGIYQLFSLFLDNNARASGNDDNEVTIKEVGRINMETQPVRSLPSLLDFCIRVPERPSGCFENDLFPTHPFCSYCSRPADEKLYPGICWTGTGTFFPISATSS